MPDIQASIVLNRNLYFLVSFSIIAISTIWQIIIDWLKSESSRKELQTKNMQSELKFLKSQINPHFLFNTLNNLYALTLKKSDLAPEIVLKLSEIMRYMLYECNEKRVFLRNELNYIQNYLDLEKLRQGQKVTINFTVKGNPDQLLVAPLIFTPFLENSFKHGLSNILDQGFVNIFLEIKDENILFLIENSKTEKMPQKQHAISGGIGLVNVKQRLELIYPNQYELIIDNSPTVYSVTLKIKADKN
jgi:LytS/YehU family sensor histidine kinase